MFNLSAHDAHYSLRIIEKVGNDIILRKLISKKEDNIDKIRAALEIFAQQKQNIGRKVGKTIIGRHVLDLPKNINLRKEKVDEHGKVIHTEIKDPNQYEFKEMTEEDVAFIEKALNDLKAFVERSAEEKKKPKEALHAEPQRQTPTSARPYSFETTIEKKKDKTPTSLKTAELLSSSSSIDEKEEEAASLRRNKQKQALKEKAMLLKLEEEEAQKTEDNLGLGSSFAQTAYRRPQS